MRKATVKVQYQVPEGKELVRLTKKSTVSYIYIGKGLSGPDKGHTCVQINDKMVNPEDVSYYMRSERNRMSPEDVDRMMVSIKADKDTKMGVITDVKEALREANTLRISYSATEKK